MPQTAQAQADEIDEITIWFLVLRRAHLTHDHERAAEAIRALRRLGCEVRFVLREARHD